MKKIILLIIVALLPQFAIAQSDPVSSFFDKYEDSEGFTTVHISGRMFKMFMSKEAPKEDETVKSVLSNLDGIRILAFGDDGDAPKSGKYYYNQLMDNLPSRQYEELMIIKEEREKIKFMVREERGEVRELLMVVGGDDTFVLISLNGIIDLDKISEIANSIHIDGMEHLNNMNEDCQPVDNIR